MTDVKLVSALSNMCMHMYRLSVQSFQSAYQQTVISIPNLIKNQQNVYYNAHKAHMHSLHT